MEKLRLSMCFMLAFSGLANASDLQFEPVPVPDHFYTGGWEHFVGGGVAVFDCNDDGLPEIYAAGGTDQSQFFLNVSDDDVQLVLDTPDALALTGMTGVYPLDIDGDDRIDLAILRVGEDILLRGLGDCVFEPFNNLDFVSADHWTTAFSATWEDGNDLPTLVFGTYVDRSDPDGPFEACDGNLLYRPEAGRYSGATQLTPGYCALSILFSDWNRDGQADLRVSNDRHYYVRGGQEQLWKLDAQPRLYSKDDGWNDYSIWGMGIASRDLTGDGLPEVYLTSMGDQKLQIFDGTDKRPVWRDATYDYGTTAHRPHSGGDGRPSTGWHAQFADLNNDGRDDIFVAKGNVEQMPVAAMDDPNSLLIQNEDGRFSERSVEAGLASMARSRGAAVVDLNADGRLDVVVVNRRAPLEVYQNTSSDLGNWVSIQLSQDGHNSRAVGAFIEIKTGDRTLVREVTVGGGHAGGQAVPEHFGLGLNSELEMRVRWPDGQWTEWQTIEVNRSFALRRNPT